MCTAALQWFCIWLLKAFLSLRIEHTPLFPRVCSKPPWLCYTWLCKFCSSKYQARLKRNAAQSASLQGYPFDSLANSNVSIRICATRSNLKPTWADHSVWPFLLITNFDMSLFVDHFRLSLLMLLAIFLVVWPPLLPRQFFKVKGL